MLEPFHLTWSTTEKKLKKIIVKIPLVVVVSWIFCTVKGHSFFEKSKGIQHFQEKVFIGIILILFNWGNIPTQCTICRDNTIKGKGQFQTSFTAKLLRVKEFEFSTEF